MTFTGANFIGFNKSAAGEKSFQAFAPATDSYLEGNFTIATKEEFDQAFQLAESAFSIYNEISPLKRAKFLDTIADEVMALGDILLERCSAESGLPIGRITGERGRTCGQLKMFAQLIRDGWYVDARIDTAQPGRQPLPKSDIRRMLVPIGPVAVFGASNFPLAFSTAGGDTASALAAGCPVIVKAHSSHAGTNELVSSAIIKAAKKTGMPDGVFSSLYLSHEDAMKLVEHPIIKAVGFTGSRKVGMQLFNAAVARPVPIPVYAEMSAINPVVLLPNALSIQRDKIAKDLATSVTMGAGQFCTNPGLILIIESEAAQSFLLKFAGQIRAVVPATMLNKNICKAYNEGTSELEKYIQVSLVAKSSMTATGYQAIPAVYSINATDFMADKEFSKEVFGPTTLVVLCKDETQLLTVLNELEGQLTVTIHATDEDESRLKPIINIVTQKAGRVIYGGYPTGVEVCHAMQHGGPFPSTTDARSTSVGSSAIYRFLRPVAFQDFPDKFLPEALGNANVLNILRLIDGNWTTAEI
jgi:2,5-dioxopentanoate dehydrogenase